MNGRQFKMAALVFSVALIVGCGVKPPGCAEPETVALAKQMVADDVRDTIQGFADALPEPNKKRLGELGNGFASGLKIELVNIVSNGYDANAKKYTCGGKLSATDALTKQGLQFDIEYTTQRTEDDKTKFMLQISRFKQMVKELTEITFLAYAAEKNKLDSAANPGQAAAEHAKERQAVETQGGVPAAHAEYSKSNGIVKIDRSGGTVKFAINSSAGDHVCELEGTAKLLDTSTARMEGEKPDACSVMLHFSSGDLIVSTSQCADFCGANAGDSMEGLYKK